MSAVWSEVELIMRERAYRHLDNDPQILFDRDGGPVDLDVDLIYARLIGFDEEIVEDGMRLSHVMPTIMLPIYRPIRLADTYDPYPSMVINTARYELQSGYSTLSVAAEYLPPVEKLRPDFTARIAYLRYRRRA